MTPDQRWYEAVKHFKKAAELLETKLEELTIIDSRGEERKRIAVTFQFPVEETEQGES